MHANQFNVLSTGKAAEMLQANPVRLAEIAQTLGIRPVGHINGVPYFDATDIERIGAHLQAAARPMIINREPSY